MNKVKNSLAPLLVAALVTCSTNFASGQETKDTIKYKKDHPMVIEPAKPKDSDMVVNPGAPAGGNVALTDTGFINKNITDNMMELQLAKMALSQGKGAQIKKVAAQLVSDHSAILNGFKRLAPGNNSQSTASAMGIGSSAAVPDLEVEQGSTFNATWASKLLTLHTAKVDEMEKFAAVTQNEALKALIGVALPKIRVHIEMLSKIPGAKLIEGPNTVTQ